MGLRKSTSLYRFAFRDELAMPVDPTTAEQLQAYFRRRQQARGHFTEPAADRVTGSGAAAQGDRVHADEDYVGVFSPLGGKFTDATPSHYVGDNEPERSCDEPISGEPE